MKKIIEAARALLPKKSVAGILCQFNKVVAELEAHAAAMKDEAQRQMLVAEEAEAKAVDALAEQHHAVVAAESIKGLIGNGPLCAAYDQEHVGAL